MRNCCNEFFTALKRVEKLYLVHVEVGKRLQEKCAHDETYPEAFYNILESYQGEKSNSTKDNAGQHSDLKATEGNDSVRTEWNLDVVELDIARNQHPYC